jgi:hypothetical protein
MVIKYLFCIIVDYNIVEHTCALHGFLLVRKSLIKDHDFRTCVSFLAD